MTRGFNGKEFYTGSDYRRKFTFTRQSDDDVNYTDATVFVDFYDTISSTSPMLSLSSATSAIDITTNEQATQVFTLTLTAANLTTLLNSQTNQNIVGYVFKIQPDGGNPQGQERGKGWDGVIRVMPPAYSAQER
ncbi:MAG: hypothetical protein AAF959_11105 [Cyanobacteria bacterium P01_D01_bin.56]